MVTSRTYGSVDHMLSADSSLLPRPATSASVHREDIDDCPSRASGQDSGTCDVFKRYFTLAITCGFAVTTFMFASRGGKTLAEAGGGSRSNSGQSSLSGARFSTEQQKPAIRTPGNLSNERLPASPQQDAPLEFTALNFYHIRDGKPGASYPWLSDFKLVEPHRETTLAVANVREGFHYQWEVHTESAAGVEGTVVHATAAGPDAVVVLTELDENVITLEEVDATGVVVRRLQETVMVKYVRREIRLLTDEERDELLDAVSETKG